MTRFWTFVVALLLAVPMSQATGLPVASASPPSVQVFDGPYLWDVGDDFPELHTGISLVVSVVCDFAGGDGDAVLEASVSQVVQGRRTTASAEPRDVECVGNPPSNNLGLSFFGERDFRPGKATFTFKLSGCPVGCPHTVTKTLNIAMPPPNFRERTVLTDFLFEHPCTSEVLSGTVSSSVIIHFARTNMEVQSWFHIAMHGEVTGQDSGRSFRFHFHATDRYPTANNGLYYSLRTVLSGAAGAVASLTVRFKLSRTTGEVEWIGVEKRRCR